MIIFLIAKLLKNIHKEDKKTIKKDTIRDFGTGNKHFATIYAA